MSSFAGFVLMTRLIPYSFFFYQRKRLRSWDESLRRGSLDRLVKRSKLNIGSLGDDTPFLDL